MLLGNPVTTARDQHRPFQVGNHPGQILNGFVDTGEGFEVQVSGDE